MNTVLFFLKKKIKLKILFKTIIVNKKNLTQNGISFLLIVLDIIDVGITIVHVRNKIK